MFAGAFLPMIGYGLDDCSTLTGYNIPTTECDILVEFYNATDGSGWNDDTNRLTDSDACNWAGIDCTDVMGQDHVSNIWMAGNGLSGTLIANISGLTYLSTISVGVNWLYGTLPEEWSVLSNLTLIHIHQNAFTGELPDSRSALTGLQVLYAYGNQLNGVLPESRSSMVDMAYFSIEDNNFTWPLPESYDARTELYRFAASANDFTGTLPVSWSAWEWINTFLLTETPGLEGVLPSERETWGESIEAFTIWSDTDGVGIGGSLPSERSARTNIISFAIVWSDISGELPTSRSAWEDITYFTIEDTPIEGDIPYSWIERDNIDTFTIENTDVADTDFPEESGGSSSSLVHDDDQDDNANEDEDDNSDGDVNNEEWDDTDSDDDNDPELEDDGNNSDAASHAKNDCSDDETNNAYVYARWLNITTIQSCTEAQPDGILLRKHAAKMLSEFAISVLWRSLNSEILCEFSDMKQEDEEMQYYAETACQLGLMGLDGQWDPIDTFSPNEPMTMSQLGTVVSRMLRWDTYNSSETCRYCDHLNALHGDGIMTKIDTPDTYVLRGWLLIMLERVGGMDW